MLETHGEAAAEVTMGTIRAAAEVLGIPAEVTSVLDGVCKLAGRPVPREGIGRSLAEALIERLDAVAVEPLTPRDLADAARVPDWDSCLPPIPQELVDVISSIDVRTARLPGPGLREAAADLAVPCHLIDSAIMHVRHDQARADRQVHRTGPFLPVGEAFELDRAAEEDFTARLMAELRADVLDDETACTVLRWALRAHLAPLGDLILRLSAWPMVTVPWLCPPAGYHREMDDHRAPLAAVAWKAVPGAPEPLQARITTKPTAEPDAHRPFYPAASSDAPAARPGAVFNWSVGWRIDQRFVAYGSASETTLQAAQIGAAALIHEMLKEPAMIRQRLYGRLFVPRSGNPLQWEDARLITLQQVLSAVAHALQSPQDADCTWVMRPHYGGEHGLSCIGLLLEHLSLPLPDRGSAAADALPDDSAFTGFFDAHAIAFAPLAAAYLSGLGATGPGPQPLADRHTAAMRILLADRTTGREALAVEIAMPAGTDHQDLIDAAGLERWCRLLEAEPDHDE
jgi:hypothetical protein